MSRLSSGKHQPRDAVMLRLEPGRSLRGASIFYPLAAGIRIVESVIPPHSCADLRFRNPAAFLLPLLVYSSCPTSLQFMMVRLAAEAWVLLLAATAGRAYAYMRHTPLPSFTRRRMVTTGARSLKCDATSPLIEVRKRCLGLFRFFYTVSNTFKRGVS